MELRLKERNEASARQPQSNRRPPRVVSVDRPDRRLLCRDEFGEPARVVVRSAADDLSVYLSSAPGRDRGRLVGAERPDRGRARERDRGRVHSDARAERAWFVRVRIGRERVKIFVTPGSQPEIDVASGGAEWNSGVSFEGDHVEENQFLRDQRRAWPRWSASSGGRAISCSHKHTKASSRSSQISKRLRAKAVGAFPRFSTRHRSAVRGPRPCRGRLLVPSDAGCLPWVHSEVTGEPARVAEGYNEEIGSASLADPTLLDSQSFIQFLDQYVKRQMAVEAGVESMDLPREKLLSRYRTIRSLDADPEIVDYLLEQLFRAFAPATVRRDWGRVLDELAEDRPDHPSLPRLRARSWRPTVPNASCRRRSALIGSATVSSFRLMFFFRRGTR